MATGICRNNTLSILNHMKTPAHDPEMKVSTIFQHHLRAVGLKPCGHVPAQGFIWGSLTKPAVQEHSNHHLSQHGKMLDSTMIQHRVCYKSPSDSKITKKQVDYHQFEPRKVMFKIKKGHQRWPVTSFIMCLHSYIKYVGWGQKF